MSGVQPWSKGVLFPAVIGKRERYNATGEFLTESAILILDGREEEYATYDDAAQVARAVLADASLRARWRKSWPNGLDYRTFIPYFII